MVPRATYRVQFNKQFRFEDAANLAPYLSELGISHVYASPYLKARPNSTHGYDITDHNSLNPELGDEAAFFRMVGAFEAHGLKHILDYVPNHMGVGGSDNPLWLDVLEWGKDSIYGDWFDVDWESHAEYLSGKVLVPFLADQYGAELAAGKLRLKFDEAAGEFAVWAYDVHKLPVSPRCYPRILGNEDPELEKIADEFSVLPEHSPQAARRATEIKQQFAQLARERADVRSALDTSLERFQGSVDDLGTWSRLDELIQQQHWRPAHFRVAADDVNYRRFFNISDLAGIRMELPEAYEYTHRFVLDLLRKGLVDGLRIDHIDGLFDPKAYLRRLRESAGSSFYLLVEKILARHETLRTEWPVDGTTGYEFASQLTELLTNADAEHAFSETYRSFTGETKSFAEIVHQGKTRIMENEMTSRLLTLATRAARIARQNPASADFTQNLFYRALKEIIACFPVYRTYVDDAETAETDRRYIRWAISHARKNEAQLDDSVFDFLERLLTCDLVRAPQREYNRHSVVELAMQAQQYSGPVMAKGFEDTALFRYNRLAALNEVGGSPDHFGSSVAAFHKENLHRAHHWPRTLLATSTHDTKHSEDARARLAALSLLPEEWSTRVAGWSKILRARRGDVEFTAPPSRNDEYLLFQNLIATWPAELTGSSSLQQSAVNAHAERLIQGTVKSVREARVHSNWTSPNEVYEKAVAEFIQDTLNLQRSEAFFASFLPFQERIAVLGVRNSLVQTVLKLTSPGVPDFYQGCELWDLSLVDPDNRRPVDYSLRRRLLEEIKRNSQVRKCEMTRGLLQHWQDGSIKLFVTSVLLAYRKSNSELFAKGTYHPLTPEGFAAEKLCAFRRQEGSTELLTIVSTDARLDSASLHDTKLPIHDPIWSTEWCDLFTGRLVRLENAYLPLREVFSELPVAVFVPFTDSTADC
jgi:(1->4)-alpha-D-glucan 1-alpha-D-glucosylmutase